MFDECTGGQMLFPERKLKVKAETAGEAERWFQAISRAWIATHEDEEEDAAPRYADCGDFEPQVGHTTSYSTSA